MHDAVKTALLGRQAVVGVSARAPSVEVHGEGGRGKTVIAQAIAQDDEITRAFPDGIFWVTVGQHPRLESLQSELAMAVGSPVPIENVPNGIRALRESFRGRSCLVILDDVWQFAHAKAFDVLDGSARLLVTTRDRTILTALGAHDVRLEGLPPDLALELLASWAGVPKAGLPAEAAAITKEVDFLPLARVAGRRPDSRRGILARPSRRAQGREPRLPRSPLRQRLQVAPGEPRRTRRGRGPRYVELAVFPEDVDVPHTVVAEFWRTTGGLDARAKPRAHDAPRVAQFGSPR